jgi:hypothetical protein
MKRMTLKDSPNIQRVLQWENECVDTAEERLAAEATELRALGVLDEHGRPTSAELPEDMQPQSTADTSAL